MPIENAKKKNKIKDSGLEQETSCKINEVLIFNFRVNYPNSKMILSTNR